MTWCKLTPLYTEEPNDYHLLSTCLFVKQNYIKTTKGIVKDMGSLRRKQFISTIKKHIQSYDKGYWDDKYRLRIHFDNSFERNDELMKIFNEYKHHPFIQWVKYELPNLKDPEFKKDHIGMIGMIVRQHPLFVKNNKINCVSIIDMDSWYTDSWKQVLIKFKKSKYDFHAFNSIFSIQFYGTIMPGISLQKNPNFWVPGGMFSSKIRFPDWRWNQIPEFINNHMLPTLRFFDSFKVALFDNKIDRMMEEYEYGLDEMYLNYIVNYYISKQNLSIQLTPIHSYNNIQMVTGRILTYIKWNEYKTYRTHELYTLLHVKNFEELTKKINNITTLPQLIKVFRHKPILDLLKSLQFDRRIIHILEYVENDDLINSKIVTTYLN
jgi:hypothetical protein